MMPDDILLYSQLLSERMLSETDETDAETDSQTLGQAQVSAEEKKGL